MKLQEGGGLGGDNTQTRRSEVWERVVRWTRLDHAVLKDQAEDPGTMGCHGGWESREGTQFQFMSYKNPSGVSMGCPGG